MATRGEGVAAAPTDWIKVTMIIPGERMGHVIGRRRTRLCLIEAASGAQANIVSSGEQRIIELRGTAAAVQAAREAILAKAPGARVAEGDAIRGDAAPAPPPAPVPLPRRPPSHRQALARGSAPPAVAAARIRRGTASDATALAAPPVSAPAPPGGPVAPVSHGERVIAHVRSCLGRLSLTDTDSIVRLAANLEADVDSFALLNSVVGVLFDAAVSGKPTVVQDLFVRLCAELSQSKWHLNFVRVRASLCMQ